MNFKQNKLIIGFLHIMIWFVLFMLPYLLSSGQNQAIKAVLFFSWIPLFLYSIIFYCNYFVLIERFLFSKKIIWFVIANLILITLFIWANQSIKEIFFDFHVPHNDKNDDFRPSRSLFIYSDFILFSVPVVFSIAVKTTERWIKTEVERKEAVTIKLESELQHLKYQLQPHFFFNSLNNIYSLVDTSPEQAKQTIHSLSKLMRYLLYQTNDEKVSLKSEIQFIVNYIELMKLRFTENTKIEYDFPVLKTDLQVVPLLFISLIENAFKHGVSASQQSEIIFKMTIDENRIDFSIKNHNFPKTESDKSGSGIGLQNMKKRLKLLYPDKHEFNAAVVDGFFIVNLTLET
ncbi:sensor histidine kinase [Flavobacterium ginsenosidimutans]|uniref:Histidine kinase n=1 Tax=Flavobacterium ginsenosidimutans TaxID=687844 RepID=A0ABZ2Q8X2_9FLAO|nr:histidine kinase [Flavobacterium ginsenosidimutans]